MLRDQASACTHLATGVDLDQFQPSCATRFASLLLGAEADRLPDGSACRRAKGIRSGTAEVSDEEFASRIRGRPRGSRRCCWTRASCAGRNIYADESLWRANPSSAAGAQLNKKQAKTLRRVLQKF